MHRLRFICGALIVMLTATAFVTASASAETTLLAEWLIDGNDINPGVHFFGETSGAILLEDKGAAGAAAVLCSMIFSDSVTENGEGRIEKLLNLSEGVIEELGGLALLGTGNKLPDCETEKTCEEGSATKPIEVWPLELNGSTLVWPTLLFLMEVGGTILNLVEDAGYELLCWVLLVNVEDHCVAKDTELEVINDADDGDAAIPNGATAEPLFNCTLGGAGTGVNTTDELMPIVLNNGELLTVSSE